MPSDLCVIGSSTASPSYSSGTYHVIVKHQDGVDFELLLRVSCLFRLLASQDT